MDSNTEKILERARLRREALDQELHKTPSLSPSSSSASRKRRPLEETANVAAESSEDQPKRQSLGNETPSAELADQPQLYPVEELKRLSEEKSDFKAPEEKQPSGGEFQRGTVNSSTRKARFAALSAQVDEFEVDTGHSVVIPPRYESPKMSPQPARKWSESKTGWTPADGEKSVAPSLSEKRSKSGEVEDCGIETFAVTKTRELLESASSIDDSVDMVVVYNEKSSSDSDNSVSPVKQVRNDLHPASNIRTERSPASVTPKKVLFSDVVETPIERPQATETNVTPSAAIAALNAQSGGSDPSKVGKLASPWEQKLSGFKGVPKSPQAVPSALKFIKPAVTPENPGFGDKLKKFESSGPKPVAKPVILAPYFSGVQNVVNAAVIRPVIPSPTDLLRGKEKREEIKNLRNRWEIAAATGQLLQPGKKLEENHDEITSVAMRVFTPRNPRPVSVPNMDRLISKPQKSDLAATVDKAKSTMDIAQTVEESREQVVKPCPVAPKLSEDSDESLSQRVSTETESSCVSTDTDDFELESYLNEAMSRVDQMDMKMTPPPASVEEEKPTDYLAASSAPLVHTISFYRNMTKTQNVPNHNKPVRVETPKQLSPSKGGSKSHGSRVLSYKDKMKVLNEEVNRQQNVITQASHALNVCKNSDEFRGSTEEVEAEKLLLIATNKRMSCLNEIDRLGKLIINGVKPSTGPYGTLNISDVTVPLKREFINANINGSEDEMIYYFICLIKHNEQVISSEMVSSHQAVLKQQLEFCNYVQLSPLTADFVVTFEIYQLVTRKESLTHAEKYRINTISSKGKRANATATSAHSIATPGGIRTSNFDLAGSMTIDLQSLKSNKFALQGVKFNSPIETWVHLKLRCLSECSAVEEKGFLNWYEEVSGVGAWQRRWCSLEDNQIKCWRYPDEEATKEPMSQVDLTACANIDVRPVNKDICTRSHSFMLMLPVRTESKQFVAKSLLVSADTKEDFGIWCSALNEVFRSVRQWNPSPLSPSKFSTLV